MKNSNITTNSNNNNGANNTKLILLHPYILKQGTPNKVWLLAFASLFTFIIIFLFSTVVYTSEYYYETSTTTTVTSPDHTTTAAHDNNLPLPKHVMTTLLHYASNANTTDKMSLSDMKSISDVLRKCPSPCNFLVFGLSHETLLWRNLNNHGRTVFIDENRYYAAYMEETHPEIEAYDVQYTTKLSEYKDLITAAKQQINADCKPVQNLLFSECRLGINDLPNQFYEIEWDLILIDGPRGHWDDAPGRMAPIFTAGVLARSKKSGGGSRSGGASRSTHIFVHDYNMEAQRLACEEFLCKENFVGMTSGGSGAEMAHYVIERVEDGGSNQFCRRDGPSDVV